MASEKQTEANRRNAQKWRFALSANDVSPNPVSRERGADSRCQI